MATVSATVRRAVNTVIGKGDAGVLRALGARTIELGASASGTVVDFKLRVPAASRFDQSSRLYWDDLATSGSPTLDIGLYAVEGNITSDDDCLNDGLALSAVSTANVGAQVVKDFANAGKTFWELAGGTGEPVGFLDVKGIVRDAATNAAGTITLDLKSYTD